MVRVHFGPPSSKEIDWSTFVRKYFIESLEKETHHVPWKLNIVIMMQLWEGNSKGNFFSVSISKLRWVKIQFLAKKLLETWACIIQLIENRLDYLWVDLRSVKASEGQANKSARGMPWHQEPMKDVISCDKLRGVANEHWSGDFRMGKPTVRYPILNQIGIGGEPPELKHLSRARKRHQPRFRE